MNKQAPIELPEKYHGEYWSSAVGYVSEPQRSRRQLCKNLEEDTWLKTRKGRARDMPPAPHHPLLFHTQPALFIYISCLASQAFQFTVFANLPLHPNKKLNLLCMHPWGHFPKHL